MTKTRLLTRRLPPRLEKKTFKVGISKPPKYLATELSTYLGRYAHLPGGISRRRQTNMQEHALKRDAPCTQRRAA